MFKGIVAHTHRGVMSCLLICALALAIGWIRAMPLASASGVTLVDDDPWYWNADLQLQDGSVVPADAAQVLRFYTGALGRLPDAAGFEGWLRHLRSGRGDPHTVADGFLDSSEFQALADADNSGEVSHSELVDHLYRSALGREADPMARVYWTSMLHTNRLSMADVLFQVAQSNEAVLRSLDMVAAYFQPAPTEAAPGNDASVPAVALPERAVVELTLPPPPENRRLEPHPRLLLTVGSLPELRRKLSDPVYEEDVAALRRSNHPTDQALVYRIWGDTQALEAAKDALMTGAIPEWKGLGESIQTVQAALMYDWLHDALTPAERARALGVVKQHVPHHEGFADGAKYDRLPYYWNDMWSRGAAATTVAALALAGEDSWADGVISSAYESPYEFFSPYAGGAVDVLNTLSLSSGGGAQAGTHESAGTGYEGMFLRGASVFLPAWKSATSEDVMAQTNFFARYPYYLAHFWEGVNAPGEWARQTLEMVTGMAPGEAADLSAWFLDRYGRAKYGLALRLLLGDLRSATPRSPAELELPLATYLDGSDLVVSRTGWGPDDLAVFLFARHWDTSRYEPDSGALAIYKGDKPLLVRGIMGKTNYGEQNSSGMWIWRDGNMADTLGQGSTYWNKLNNIEARSERALNAADVVDVEKDYYRPETLVDFHVDGTEVVATTRYEKLLKLQGVERAERTVRHSGNVVRVIDELEVPQGTRVAFSLRLAETPEIDGNVIRTGDMEITILEPAAVDIYWSGGPGRELIGPTGEWHGSRRFGFVEGYSDSESMARQYGSGYVFVEPQAAGEYYRIEAMVEVSH